MIRDIGPKTWLVRAKKDFSVPKFLFHSQGQIVSLINGCPLDREILAQVHALAAGR
jgi:hypothetical protein